MKSYIIYFKGDSFIPPFQVISLSLGRPFINSGLRSRFNLSINHIQLANTLKGPFLLFAHLYHPTLRTYFGPDGRNIEGMNNTTFV